MEPVTTLPAILQKNNFLFVGLHLRFKQIFLSLMTIQIIDYGKFSYASDMWAFGVLLWELFSKGKIPFGGMTNSGALKSMREGYPEVRMKRLQYTEIDWINLRLFLMTCIFTPTKTETQL